MLTLEDYESLKVKSIQLNTSLKNHLETALSLKEQYKETGEKIETIKESISIQQASLEILKQVVEQLSRYHIEKITELVTLALKSVFVDRDYAFEIEVVDKRNVKNCEFFLIETRPDGVYKNSLSDAVGGGILAVVGLVLQLYYVGYFHLANVLFLDEALSQVSEQYVPYLFQFLQDLAKQKEFIIVLITHDERFMSYADRVYSVDRGVYTLVKKG